MQCWRSVRTSPSHLHHKTQISGASEAELVGQVLGWDWFYPVVLPEPAALPAGTSACLGSLLCARVSHLERAGFCKSERKPRHRQRERTRSDLERELKALVRVICVNRPG